MLSQSELHFWENHLSKPDTRIIARQQVAFGLQAGLGDAMHGPAAASSAAGSDRYREGAI
jgi:hypothetical protein